MTPKGNICSVLTTMEAYLKDNVEIFRQNYRNQLLLVLGNFKPKLSEKLELSGDILWLEAHPSKNYYYLLTLSLAKERLNEL